MLLARNAKGTTSSQSPSLTPNALNPGTFKSRTNSRNHSTPSSASAPASPVNQTATRSNRLTCSPVPRSLTARKFTAHTAGSSAAHTSPCAIPYRPPSGAANPCTAPNPAFAKAIPLNNAAKAISDLAPTSAPSPTTRLNDPTTFPTPPAHSASVIGFARTQTKASNNCVNASIPVTAVTAAGTDTANSGSITANLGNMDRCLKLTFTPASGQHKTAFRVASAPVPAVVGTATNGSGSRSNTRPVPITSTYSRTDPIFATNAAIAFPASTTAPPPTASTHSQPAPFATATPDSTPSIVGSPATANTTTSIPAASSKATTFPSLPPLPVTTITRRPNTPHNSPKRPTLPTPNTTCPGPAHSNASIIPIPIPPPIVFQSSSASLSAFRIPHSAIRIPQSAIRNPQRSLSLTPF